jgi:hypothetical protein
MRMTISTTHEAGTECPSTGVDEVIDKAAMVDGVTIILQNENADYWLLPGAIEEMVHTFMTTGFKSLQVHPAFRRQVRAIASRQFKAAYGAGTWSAKAGAGFSVRTLADELRLPVAIHTAHSASTGRARCARWGRC